MANGAAFGMPYEGASYKHNGEDEAAEQAALDALTALSQAETEPQKNAARDAVLTASEACGKVRQKRVYGRFVSDVEAAGDISAACWMTGAAHGYSFETMLTQHENGQVFRHSVSDFSSNGVQSTPDTPVDLHYLVSSLVDSDIRLDGSYYPVNSLNDQPEIRGRGRTLFVYSKTKKGWLNSLGLLLGGVYADTPLTRLLAAMEGINDKVTLT